MKPWKINNVNLSVLVVSLFGLLARKSKGKRVTPPPAPTVIRAKPPKT